MIMLLIIFNLRCFSVQGIFIILTLGLMKYTHDKEI